MSAEKGPSDLRPGTSFGPFDAVEGATPPTGGETPDDIAHRLLGENLQPTPLTLEGVQALGAGVAASLVNANSETNPPKIRVVGGVVDEITDRERKRELEKERINELLRNMGRGAGTADPSAEVPNRTEKTPTSGKNGGHELSRPHTGGTVHTSDTSSSRGAGRSKGGRRQHGNRHGHDRHSN
jgi:hypothetical protein